MKLSVAIQMDPVESLQISGDTTFELGLEAQKRGHDLWYYTPDRLSLSKGRPIAWGKNLTFYDNPDCHYKIGEINRRCLNDFDVILMRQDPPFDMAYITATYILEMLNKKTLVINNPAEVRNAPEKLFVTLFPDLMPPTLISRDICEISSFRDDHKDIIVKPLFGNGGSGVFRIKPDDENLNSLLEMFFSANNEPLIIQAYVSEVKNGDKRVILIDGKPVGAVNRIPKKGETRSNFHAGGTAEKSELTSQDKKICERIGPELKRRGLLFVGIDIIGGFITEINVTSPTGIREIRRLSKINIADKTWELIELKKSNKFSRN